MPLGNHKEFDHIYIDGECVGWTESSEDICIGTWCTGVSYNGKTISSINLDINDETKPNAMITEFVDYGSQERKIDIGGTDTLEHWDMFLTDMLRHIKQLRRGKAL